MEDNYCDYMDQKWIDKIQKLNNGDEHIEIEGNTAYIFRIMKPHIEPEYEKVCFGLYKRKDTTYLGKCERIAMLCMCKCHERTLLEWLQSYGFIIDFKDWV